MESEVSEEELLRAFNAMATKPPRKSEEPVSVMLIIIIIIIIMRVVRIIAMMTSK